MRSSLALLSVLSTATLGLGIPIPIPLEGDVVASASDSVDSVKPASVSNEQDVLEDDSTAWRFDEHMWKSTQHYLKLDAVSNVTQKPMAFRLDLFTGKHHCSRPTVHLQQQLLETYDNWDLNGVDFQGWEARQAKEQVANEDWSNIGYLRTIDKERVPAEWKYLCNFNDDGISESMTLRVKLMDSDIEFGVIFDQVEKPKVISVSNAEYSLCDFQEKGAESRCPIWPWEMTRAEPDSIRIKDIESELDFFNLRIKEAQDELEELTGKPVQIAKSTDQLVNTTIHVFGVLCTILALFSLTGLCVLRRHMRSRRLSKSSSSSCLGRTARRQQRRERRRQRREKRKALKQSLHGLLSHFNLYGQSEELPTAQDNVDPTLMDEKAAMLMDGNSEEESAPCYTARISSSEQGSVEDELAGLGRVVSLVSDIISVSQGTSRSRRPSQTDSLPPYSDNEDGHPPDYDDGSLLVRL